MAYEKSEPSGRQDQSLKRLGSLASLLKRPVSAILLQHGMFLVLQASEQSASNLMVISSRPRAQGNILVSSCLPAGRR